MDRWMKEMNDDENDDDDNDDDEKDDRDDHVGNVDRNNDNNNDGSNQDEDDNGGTLRTLGYGLSKRKFAFSTWVDKTRFECPNIKTCAFKEFDYIGDEEDSKELLRTWTDDMGPDQPKNSKLFTPWGRSRRKNFVQHPPVTLATILFVWLHICGDLRGMIEVFTCAPEIIARDVRKANLERLFHFSVFDIVLRQCQEAIFEEGSVTASRLIRSITHILVNRICERSTPDITAEGIDEKLRFLFSDMPRVQEGNMRFYGIRCGLVYGSMAAYERKHYNC
ncbi:uncharacterized protein LOC62_07G009355 [Vanrija pseudolonga]|uniref:Uncharacterized protein n=1 Tax=Vanrija pseudolonga TaxID=143232 RepID=A0AAF0YGA3_9TREE|nr:hypothetical protein LOC62_07G009355 [Vanrija pseudolonga]